MQLNLTSRNFDKIGKSNVISANAMLASSHPIASAVGLEILKSGGNAIDAAIAMKCYLLTVVQRLKLLMDQVNLLQMLRQVPFVKINYLRLLQKCPMLLQFQEL